jgi:hypothetical protein
MLHVLKVCVAMMTIALPGQPEAAPTKTARLLLIDEAHTPRASIAWPTVSGTTAKHEADVLYMTPEERIAIGPNLECFVAVGGTRLDYAAGHPQGAIVRVGFYKVDNAVPFFADLKDNAPITIELRNITLNQSVLPNPSSVLQHIKYTPEDIANCSLAPDQTQQYNTASPTDTLGGIITARNGRLGAMGGTRKGDGKVTFTVEPDGSITMKAVFPYALLRHVRDPWLRTTPGTFFEPYHFHIEYEILPEHIAQNIIDEAKPEPESP